MSRYEDNLDPEDQDVQFEEQNDTEDPERRRRRINRQDAALTAAESLTNEEFSGKTVQVWSASQ
jgi:hypothetical protein